MARENLTKNCLQAIERFQSEYSTTVYFGRRIHEGMVFSANVDGAMRELKFYSIEIPAGWAFGFFTFA